jgi:arabinose-5-phosphate isomerase
MSTQSDKSLSVADVMLKMNACPLADERTILKEVLEAMDKHRLGVVCIVDQDMHLTGILTEGDVRRKLLRVQKPLAALLADDVITHAVNSPISITADVHLMDALDLMDEKKIWDLPVVDADMKVVGLLHLHQAIRGVLQSKTGND